MILMIVELDRLNYDIELKLFVKFQLFIQSDGVVKLCNVYKVI